MEINIFINGVESICSVGVNNGRIYTYKNKNEMSSNDLFYCFEEAMRNCDVNDGNIKSIMNELKIILDSFK